MAIKIGEKIPTTTFYVMGDEGPESISSDELFGGIKVIAFGLPGAFTPTCSQHHLPGYVSNAEAFAKKGINRIICISVNDAFVMGAWGKEQNVGDAVVMAADGSAEFAKATGLELDLTYRGFGMRSQRFSMVVDDGIVQDINIEEPGAFENSSAEVMLASL